MARCWGTTRLYGKITVADILPSRKQLFKWAVECRERVWRFVWWMAEESGYENGNYERQGFSWASRKGLRGSVCSLFLESRIPLLHLSRYLSLGVPGYFQGARIFPHFDTEAASANKKPWLALVFFDGAIVSPTHDITLADRADHLLSRPELPHTPYGWMSDKPMPMVVF